jgi:hypothetical protein
VGIDSSYGAGQNVFNDSITVYDSVKIDGSLAVLNTDYSVSNGIITFLTAGNYTFMMTNGAIVSHSSYPAKVLADITVAPVFTIAVETDGNGSAEVVGGLTSAPVGLEITLRHTANPNYQFKNWEVLEGGVTVTDNTFTMPAANVKVKATFEPATGIVETGHAPCVRVFPNPTTGQLVIDCRDAARHVSTVEVFDVVGRMLMSVETRHATSLQTIDVSSLAKGMYFLKVEGKVVKFVKE